MGMSGRENKNEDGLMRVIEVGCAMIIKDGKLLAAQRNPGDTFGGFWEFPGGKKEDGDDGAVPGRKSARRWAWK